MLKDLFKNILRNNEDRAGLYITIIFHLVVIIVLLASQFNEALKREESFVLDFSREEEIERRKQEEAFKEDISKRLDELIAASRKSSESIRNIAVDAGSRLKDDRNTDAEQLYKDAERLAQELRNGQNAIQEDAREETVDMSSQNRKQDASKKEFSGPSVLTYNLEGRKASHLKIPSYRCYGSGDVTVIITVNRSGTVVGAKVLDAVSSSDKCLRDYAIRAARLSRFSASETAPPNQTGEILYRFIAQ